MRHALLSIPAMAEALGRPPAGVSVSVWDGTGTAPDEVAGTTFWVPPFLLADVTPWVSAMPALEVVQLTTAGADVFVGQLPDGVILCDGRGVHSGPTSEWAVAAVLAALREFPRFIRAQAAGRWDRVFTDELAGKRVLIVGAGDIGEQIARRLDPFEPRITRVARRARPGVRPVTDLPALLPEADVVIVIVPLTEATRGMVDAAFLARMPDGALLVNAARGPVVDTGALLAELTSGRLRAAVDVTDPEPLPTGHPLWSAPNLLLTPHIGGAVPGFPRRAVELVRAQLARYAAGQDPLNVVVDGY